MKCECWKCVLVDVENGEVCNPSTVYNTVGPLSPRLEAAQLSSHATPLACF